jgi:UDP-N-acetylglucosamine diphosphorylase/glucosamine-1-phosphate N-acetyltransferase
MRVCIFEDTGVADLEPLTLTRPAFDLLCGTSTLAAKHCQTFAAQEVGFLVRPHLADLVRLQNPGKPVNDPDWLRSAPTVLVNARWLPRPGSRLHLTEAAVALAGSEVAYVVAGTDQLAFPLESLDDALETWNATLPHRDAGGRMVRYLWDLIDANPERITLDWQAQPSRPQPRTLPEMVGPADRLMIDPTARLDPLVMADTRRGPVVIEREAVVTSFTRLEGPCFIGAGTQIHGANIRAGTSLGPQCRIGGEVEASIILGNSNKYHDGFLGHAYLGEWVNLAAGTQSSDLRNDYGEVTVMVNGRPRRSGHTKVGCYLGDHTKAGLGALLNTGTNAGIFCNLLPSGFLLPRYVPSFASWWNGRLTDGADVDALLRTAVEVMQRRGRVLGEVHARLYREVFEQTASERWRVVAESEARQLKHTA